ncbi:MAG TPA: hypothetical protein VL688_07635 [Verrucomicrobiae bacterium]|jgi:hypothetical protein|nr:hypothetical protein [Verrucomicrobiae bacterium]
MTTLESLRVLSELKAGADPHAIKVTALAYIKQAVADERYEELREMISIAQEFGATAWDIRIALMPGQGR